MTVILVEEFLLMRQSCCELSFDNSDNVVFKFVRQKYFNFKSLVSIEDNDETLHLKNIWDDEDKYKKGYKSLVKEFVKNYKQFESDGFAIKYKDFGPVL